MDSKLHSYGPVKLDKMKHLGIFLREQTCINSSVDKMISQIIPTSSFYDAKISWNMKCNPINLDLMCMHLQMFVIYVSFVHT